MLEVKKNIKPLSVNDCWRGQRFKTPAYKVYEQELLYTLPKKKLPEPPYSIYFEFGFSSKASDLDNPVKCLLDVMQKRYEFNDKEIYEMKIKKTIVKKGKEYFIARLEHLTSQV